MARRNLTITLTLRWWVAPYLNTLIMFSVLTGREPDANKVAAFIAKKGFKMRGGRV